MLIDIQGRTCIMAESTASREKWKNSSAGLGLDGKRINLVTRVTYYLVCIRRCFIYTVN